LGEQVEAMFAPELGALESAVRREVAASADLLVSFEALEHLCRVRGLSRAAATRASVRALLALLG
jgi:hypothetical protein